MQSYEAELRQPGGRPSEQAVGDRRRDRPYRQSPPDYVGHRTDTARPHRYGCGMDYQFHFLAARGGPIIEPCEAADDGEALLTAARRMQDHASCVGVRVFQGMRLICQLARPVGEAWDRPAIHGAGSLIEVGDAPSAMAQARPN